MQSQAPHVSKIRALFLDIDGTLVGTGGIISPGVRAAIARARHRGCEVVFCTGRTLFTARSVIEQIDPPYGYAITSNGGVLTHVGRGETIYRRLFALPVAMQVVRAIVDAGSEPYVFEASDVPGLEGARVLFHPDLPVGSWADFPRYRPHADILKDLPFAPISISSFGPADRMQALARHLLKMLPADVSIIQSGSEEHWGVEVYVAGISKQTGLEVVADRLAITRDQVMAIGDHLNDLEMIRWAGLGVAMGNGLPEVRAAADWVTSRLEEDGVAQAIQRYLLAEPAS